MSVTECAQLGKHLDACACVLSFQPSLEHLTAQHPHDLNVEHMRNANLPTRIPELLTDPPRLGLSPQ